ncbi:MAG: multicopper oxidase domain-containing protein [Candidatus Eremiobacteraeota bacterium]|nr:multicopper oxidase domain-containing protein [Candidatus Eremiobacteraeota bacterium]
MNRRRFVVASVSAAAAGAALASDGCSSTAVTPGPGPTSGPFVDAYTIRVRYATTRFGKYVLRTRTYGGRTFGPMLQTRPGHTLRVRIVNDLPPNPPQRALRGTVRIPYYANAADAMMGQAAGTQVVPAAAIDRMNNPHDFNTTNLHVHGVQTIPHIFEPLGTSRLDAPMIAIEPGRSYEYPFPIPSDHPSGLYFYHPHHHGSTDVQLSGGMAGLLVIRGPIDDVPEIAAAREIFLVIQSLQVNATPGKPNHFELEPIAYEPPTKGGYNLGTSYVLLTVNGQGVNWQDLTKGTGTFTPLPVPRFSMRPGEIVRLRILTGTNVLQMPLVLPGMDVYQIGVDGVNFLKPQRLEQRGTQMVTAANLYDGSTIVSTNATRNELLVRAPQTPGTYTLSAVANSGISFQAWPKFDLAAFDVSGAPVSMSLPASLPVPTREYPLITDGEIVQRRRIVFTDGATKVLLTGFGFYINGMLYDDMKCSTYPKVGTAEEWTIENETAMCGHPFHLHDNSFQVIEINGKRVDPVLICDTILVPPKAGGRNGSVKVRVRFKEHRGKTVFHCHITPHEDTGMMQNVIMT